MAGVGVGDAFPRIPSLPELDERLGKRPFVLFFYVAAATPGCAAEAKAFETSYDRFQGLGYDVVGASTDARKKNDAWCDRMQFRFPLASDEGGEAVRTLGIRSILGKAKRVTFLVDGEGRVAKIWDRVSVRGHADDVLAAIDGSKA